MGQGAKGLMGGLGDKWGSDVSASIKGKRGALPNVNLLSLLYLEIKQFNVNSERYYILHG